jgi:hypothetical protein
VKPALVGGMFAGAAGIAFMASQPFLDRGGCLALISMPLAFFAAGTLAAWALRVSLPVRVGFGVILAVGGFGSFLGLVATQAMTGRESGASNFLFFSAFFVGSYLVAIALGWFLVREIESRALTAGVLGFCAGGVVAGAVAALIMGTHSVAAFYWAVPMSLPAAGGGAAIARWLERRSGWYPPPHAPAHHRPHLP